MWACPPAADTPSPLSWGHPAWGLALEPLGSRMLEPPPASCCPEQQDRCWRSRGSRFGGGAGQRQQAE